MNENAKVDYWLSKFPMSPSVNESLVPKIWKAGNAAQKKVVPISRLVHTPVARKYLDGAIERFKGTHRVWLGKLNQHLLKRIDDGKTFDLTMYYYFAFERVFSTNGSPKKFDQSNFSKLAIDGLCRCIGIDDSLFFKDTHIKMYVPRGTATLGRDPKSNRVIVDKSKEFIVIHIKEYEMEFDPIKEIEKMKEKK